MIKKFFTHIKLHQEAWIFGIIAVLGLLFRIEYLREFSQEVYCRFAIGADIEEYDLRAKEILRGIIFPEFPEIHAPLYPFFLALFYKLTNYSVLAVRGIQLFINWLAYVFLAVLAGKVGKSPGVGKLFLIFSMFTPVIFFHNGELISETLLAPFILLALWMLYRGKRKTDLVYSGTAVGAMILTHGLMVFFAVGEIIYFIVKKQLRNAAVLAGGILLVVLPVITAKSLYYGKITGTQGNSVFNLWVGHNPDATGGCYLRPGRPWRIPQEIASREAAARNISQSRVFLENIASFYCGEPWQLLLLPLKKSLLLLDFSENIAGGDPPGIIRRTFIQKYGSGMMGAVIVLSLAGIFFAVWKKEYSYVHFYLLTGTLTVGLLLTVVSGRYRQGLMPGLLLLAALGGFYLGKKMIWVVAIFLAGGIFLTPMFLHHQYEAASIEGEAYYNVGKLEKAEKLLEYAELGMDDPGRYDNLLGSIAEKQGDYLKAEARYLAAISAEPDSPDAWLNCGHLYFYYFPSKRQNALMLINQALQRKTALPSAYDMLGVDHAQRGNVQEALKMFEKALKYAPDNELYRKKVEMCHKILTQKRKENVP